MIKCPFCGFDNEEGALFCEQCKSDLSSVAPAAPPPGPPPAPPPAGSEPKLLVIRGAKVNVEFPIYPGQNFIGRADEKPVDIDLEDQEPPDRVWTSRQHAVLEWDDGAGSLTLEDLNSSNGTY